MRRILLSALVLLAAGAFLVVAGGASNGKKNASGTYTIQLDSAFGLVTGADFKVGGVRAGTIKTVSLDTKTLHALVKVAVTVPGFGQFHTNATCESRPQSLIGEYFLGCDPGTSAAPVLKSGGVIPVSHTQSTIAPDLLNDIMRMPYRERLTLIINELGAGVAGRSSDLQAAIERAVPALTETDNLLHLLANDSNTLQDLTLNSDTVITALANNSAQVNRFIDEAGNAATDSAARRTALQATFQKLPGFLEQLKPALRKLGQAADANDPVLHNLNESSGELSRFLTDVVPFSNSSKISLKSLGKASVTGKQAVTAAGPTVKDLTTFAKSTPELGQNLAIVLHDLDDRGRAVETDSRSPGGKGFTGLEALLQYVYNQTLAVNTFTPFGHELAVDAFVDPECAPYASLGSQALALAKYGTEFRHCYSFLGPNQPGVNEPDPSDPSAPCPDPGGSAPGEPGPTVKTQCAKLTSAEVLAAADTAKDKTTPTNAIASGAAGAKRTAAASGSSGGGGTNPGGKPPISLKSTLGGLLGLFGGSSGIASSSTGSATSAASSATSGAASGTSAAASATSGATSSGSGSNQTQQLLNYLLAP